MGHRLTIQIVALLLLVVPVWFFFFFFFFFGGGGGGVVLLLHVVAYLDFICSCDISNKLLTKGCVIECFNVVIEEVIWSIRGS